MSTALTALTPAVSSLTLTDNFDDTETVTIGGVVYTMRATLGVLAGSVQLAPTVDPEADASDTLDALADAINLNSVFSGAGAGTSYTAATVINPLVVATRPSALVLKITAKVPGVIGNQITTTETHGEGGWTSTVMASGTGGIDVAVREILASSQVNAEVEQLLRHIDSRPASE